jgi:hypothetical protein
LRIKDHGNGIRQLLGDNQNTSVSSMDGMVFLDYKMELLHNDYNYMIYDSLVDLEYIDETNTTTDYSSSTYKFQSSSTESKDIVTTDYNIDSTRTLKLCVDYIDNSDTTAIEDTNFYISADSGSTWTQVNLRDHIELGISFTRVRIKIELPTVDGFEIKSLVAFLGREQSSILSGSLGKKVARDTVRNYYKTDLYNSSYSQMFTEGFVEKTNIDLDNSTCDITDEFTAETPSGQSSSVLITKTISLSSGINEAIILNDSLLNSGELSISVSNDGGSNWVTPDTTGVCTFGSQDSNLKVEIEILKAMGSDLSPKLYSFGVLF